MAQTVSKQNVPGDTLKISCIIPTQNRCQMTLEAIKSVMRQRFFRVEIIIVDDGSKDNTLAEVNDLFPGIITIKLDGVGPGQARNAGAAMATGDILMFLDSDDLWLDNHVQQLVYVLKRGFQVAYGVAQTRHELGGADFLIPENGVGIEGDCFHALLRWCFLVPSAMALKREVFEEIGGFTSLSCGEDWIFFLRLAAQFPFGFAGPEPITLRRLHPGSLCFLSDKKKLLAMISQVLTVLENEPRASAAHCHHFKMLHDRTAANMAKWSTVQDWYLSMLQEKII
jgi:glycosyltransferase involved in cell wall biosynthesis